MRTALGAGGPGEVEVLKAEREFAEATTDNDLLLGTLERLVDLDPADSETRFSLAYKHSELGNNHLALFHYLRIPYEERDEATWNNLGVAFHDSDLPAKSVGAYRTAAQKGNTLSMSNLAQILMRSGFLDEAQHTIDDALKASNPHKNVGLTMSRLKDIPDEEKKKEGELIEKARPVSDFYRELGRASARSAPADVTGKWKGPDCVLDVSLTAERLVAVGHYEKPAESTFWWVAGKLPGSPPDPPRRFRVEYLMRSTGRAFFGTVSHRPEGAPRPRSSTLLGSTDDELRVLIILETDETTIQVMEVPKSGDRRRYALQREPAPNETA